MKKIEHNKIYWYPIAVLVNGNSLATRIPVKAYTVDDRSGTTTIKFMHPKNGEMTYQVVLNSELFNSPHDIN